MEIKVPQTQLSKALNYVSRAVSIKPNIPVLANVMVEANRDNLRLTATNLDMGINMWISGEVKTEGKTTVSGKIVTDFVSAHQGGNVVLKMEGENLQVITDRSQAECRTIAAQEFPILPEAEGEPQFVIESSKLARALDKVLFATALETNITRTQYTGVLFRFSENENTDLELVGLDGYRMSRMLVPVEKGSIGAVDLIVPARPLTELVKMLRGESEEKVEVFLTEKHTQMIFKLGDIELSVRLLEGPYAEYEKVIPEGNAIEFEVDASQLEEAMKIVNTMARNVQGHRVDIDLDVETGTLVLSTKQPDLGENFAKLQATNILASNDFATAYSLQYLLDMVAHMEGSSIKFGTNSALAAAVFTDADVPGYMHLIMPLMRD